ncbi:MAG: alpha/beta fold hydrolase [Rhodobacteraceae bacterium]|nr:alpha/beta fold hydrolase [Paracoccaceae bacterium]
MIWAGLLVALLVAAFPLSEALRAPMDDTARRAAPGRFADLPSGRTHYRWDGPLRGPVAVCLHGLTVSGPILDGVAEGLARMGFRVLRYDLYGRGFSDRPPGAQDSAFFLRQLDEMLTHEGLEGDLTLVGYSMGGAIATAFAAEAPHRVDRLILLASAGLGTAPPALARIAIDLPILGDWLVQVTGGWQIRRMARAFAAMPDLPQGGGQALIAAQIAETRFRGFLPAVLSSLRHLLARDMTQAHRKLARGDIPVLALWADADEVIPPTAPGRLAAIDRRAMQQAIPGASHVMPVTHTREIHAAIQTFLRDR